MGKGIKMRSAKDHHGDTYTVEALQRLTDEYRAIPNLICDDPACGCDVRFVRRHQQNRADRIDPIDVAAYIRLERNSEHTAACGYNISSHLKVIASESDPDFLSALDNGKRELRLLVLHNRLSRYGLSGNAPTGGNASPDGSQSKTAIDIAASGRKLDSYLRTTAQLLNLRARCESDDLLASELILRFGTQRIRWEQFFFEQDRFDEAWELVAKGGNNLYPIALVGRIRSFHQPPAGATYKNSFLNCWPQVLRANDAPRSKESVEDSIAHPDASWLGGFTPDTEIIMFGFWKASAPTENVVTSRSDGAQAITYVNKKLVLNPQFKKQIAVLP